jgi:hypothetical protein
MNSNTLTAGYRFNDLVRARIVSSRGDLHEKQLNYGFPKPIKLSARSAWWPSDEVHAWLKARASLRDDPNSLADDSAEPAKRRQREIKPKEKESEIA